MWWWSPQQGTWDTESSGPMKSWDFSAQKIKLNKCYRAKERAVTPEGLVGGAPRLLLAGGATRVAQGSAAGEFSQSRGLGPVTLGFKELTDTVALIWSPRSCPISGGERAGSSPGLSPTTSHFISQPHHSRPSFTATGSHYLASAALSPGGGMERVRSGAHSHTCHWKGEDTAWHHQGRGGAVEVPLHFRSPGQCSGTDTTAPSHRGGRSNRGRRRPMSGSKAVDRRNTVVCGS